MRRSLVACAALALVFSVSAARAASDDRAIVRVAVFFPHESFRQCHRVQAKPRRVRPPAVLAGALRALLRGPTAGERARGYGGWFGPRTAGSLRSVSIVGGVAFVDFRDFRSVIGGASTTCGGAMLLAQLDRTVTQFPTVDRAIYSFNGSRRAFYGWLQGVPPVSGQRP